MSLHEGLPSPDLRPLARSPLINVVWQVRFTTSQDLSDGKAALEFQAALGRETQLSVASPKTTVQVVAGQGPPPPVEGEGRAWRLTGEDATLLTLTHSSLTVETSQYGTWSGHFLPWISVAIQSLATSVDPTVQLRVGMRYVNGIFGSALNQEPFDGPGSLVDVLDSPLLGFVADETLSTSVDGFQARHLLRFNDVRSHIQNALVTAESGELGCILDIDTYTERTEQFDSQRLLAHSEELHHAGLAVFQRCVTDEAWRRMQPIEEAQ